MIAIFIRIITQIFNDKRSLALVLIAPLFLLTLLFLLLGDSNYVPTISYQHLPNAVVTELAKEDVTLVEKDNLTTNDLQLGETDAIFSLTSSGGQVTFLEMDTVKTTKVLTAIQDALTRVNPAGKLETVLIHGQKNASTFDSLSYLLIGLLSFFFVFLLAGISFVREKTSSTLERLLVTPIRTTSLVFGYILGFGFFAAIQSLLIIVFLKFGLQIEFAGPWWVALLILLALAFVGVGLGVLISELANNEFQIMQFIPLIIVPQIFFSGLIPVDTLPYHLNYLSTIMPLYYGGTALKRVLVYGEGLSHTVLFNLGMLIIFLLVLVGLNILVINRYRKHMN